MGWILEVKPDKNPTKESYIGVNSGGVTKQELLNIGVNSGRVPDKNPTKHWGEFWKSNQTRTLLNIGVNSGRVIRKEPH